MVAVNREGGRALVCLEAPTLVVRIERGYIHARAARLKGARIEMDLITVTDDPATVLDVIVAADRRRNEAVAEGERPTAMDDAW